MGLPEMNCLSCCSSAWPEVPFKRRKHRYAVGRDTFASVVASFSIKSGVIKTLLINAYKRIKHWMQLFTHHITFIGSVNLFICQ
jgi:hypothetical protein